MKNFEEKKVSVSEKKIGSDTEIGPWFPFPIPKPVFGRTLCKTNSVQWELGSYPNSSVPWLLGSHCDNPVADDRDLLKRNVTNFTPH